MSHTKNFIHDENLKQVEKFLSEFCFSLSILIKCKKKNHFKLKKKKTKKNSKFSN